MSTVETITSTDLQEIIDDFRKEGTSLTEVIALTLIKLEESPSDRELLHQVFWSTHSLKGTADFLGLKSVSKLTHRIEELLTKVRSGEMNLSPQLQSRLRAAVGELRECFHSRGENNMQEQRTSLAAREMNGQPFGRLFFKMKVLVNFLARECGKEIELVCTGENVLLPQQLMNVLDDSLVHIIRNSCDHGIEPPEVRRKKGKPTAAVVTLTVTSDDVRIVVRVSDDGRGLDLAAIRSRATEQKLYSETEIMTVTNEQLRQCIFKPGFSTATRASIHSGRGVGMDIVRANVEQLCGRVEVYSEHDHGTSITLYLPLQPGKPNF